MTGQLATSGSRGGGVRRRSLLRRFAAGVAGAALAVGLSACRGAAPPAASERTIQFWTLDLAPKFNTYLQGVIAAWEQQNPGYRVVWTDIPWGSVERKLLAAVFARTAPDVVNLNPLFAANLASKGGLLPLDEVLPPGAPQAYLPLVWQAGRSAGPDSQPQQFAIPWYLTARITLANTRLLQQAGYSAPPRSWAEVPAYAEAVRRRMALVPQDVTILSGSVSENIAFGRPGATMEAIRAAAIAAQADGFIAALPKGYDTEVGERGITLSGGQRQRISIARAVLKDPPVLILDEATSSVDNETEAAIQRSMERISVGRTMIVIAHRLSTIRNADRIFVLENGVLCEQGQHEALSQMESGIYANLWKVQTGAFSFEQS